MNTIYPITAENRTRTEPPNPDYKVTPIIKAEKKQPARKLKSNRTDDGNGILDVLA